MNLNTPTFKLEACHLGPPLREANPWCYFQIIWIEEALETSRYLVPRGLGMHFGELCIRFLL